MEMIVALLKDCFILGLYMAVPVTILAYLVCLLSVAALASWYWVDDRGSYGKEANEVLYDKFRMRFLFGTHYSGMDYAGAAFFGPLAIGFMVLLWNYVLPVVFYIGFMYLIRYARRWQKKVDKVLEKAE
jgi:hypothetical protein